MKKILFIILICFSPLTASANKFSSVTINETKIEYVTYKVGSSDYNIKVAISDTAVELSELAINHNALTAINGIFFCPEDYSRCNGQNYTINERFQNGVDLSFYDDTGDRGVFGWDSDGIPFLFKTGYINPEKRLNIYEGLGNFPILLSSGNDNISYYDAVDLLDVKMTVAAPRHFICSNKDKTEILFGRTSSVSLINLTGKLTKIGCYDALNLDAGLSSHYIYNGADIVNGKRNIIDGIVVEHTAIDVYNIEKRLNTLFQTYFEPYRSYSSVRALRKIDSYITALSEGKNTIYDIYQKETLGETGEVNGYSINITNVEDIKKVYIINSFLKKLKKLRGEIITISQNF